ncbi:MAG: A/G-specific adenine glycosylase [Salinarimonas sp.]|nr:A/G-specific adenine glycosylase [Salinarimonas sp.]
MTPTNSPAPQSAENPPADPQALLVWYDRHRRSLPWRAPAGSRADPYRVWLSEIMLQQTTVQAVKPYYERFLARFPDVESLAEAPQDAVMQAWAGLGYYSRARNLHACAKVVADDHGGRFPADEDALRALPGIGTYTAAAVAAIAFDIPAAAVDGNVERVVSRLIALEELLPGAKPRIRTVTQAMVPQERAGDFAQAMMDLGATICTPKRPACALCPWMADCTARREGLQESFPRKAKKAPREVRHGAAFVAERADGAVLLRTRPSSGLLGGMAEVPGSDWRADYPLSQAILDAPCEARWRRLPGIVRHVFTHFPLELTIFHARLDRHAQAPDGMRFSAAEELAEEALPSVMRKVLVHALPGWDAPAVAKAAKRGAAAEKGAGKKK